MTVQYFNFNLVEKSGTSRTKINFVQHTYLITLLFFSFVANITISEVEDVEKAALKLIKEWNLGFDPIPNVIEMLEDNGVRVIEIDAPSEFDGLSTFVGDIAVAVINKNFTIERKRFTAERKSKDSESFGEFEYTRGHSEKRKTKKKKRSF